MATTQYWSGTTLVVEWTVTDPAGDPVTDATVTGEVRLPDGTSTAPMTVTPVPAEELYRATYTIADPGLHVWALEASGTATGAVEGQITAQRSLLGLAPITVDPTTNIGAVRMLITDLDEVSPLFSDAQITRILALAGSRILRAAAIALEAVAVSENLISKRIKTLDLTTDGPAVARELREMAKQLKDQDDDTDENGGTWGIDIVNYDPWAAYRRTGV